MLAEMTAIDLARLRAAGCRPTDDQVVRLNDLGLRIERGRETTVVNAPRVAMAGNVALCEPTFAALEWWHDFGRDSAWTTRGKLDAYYFMLANARDPDAFVGLEDPREIRRAVRVWRRKVYATDGEMWRALLWVRHADEDAEIQKPSVDPLADDENFDKLYRSLVAASGAIGVSPEDLKTQTPSALVALLVEANKRANIPTKPSVAKLYIAYQKLVREIEKSAEGLHDGGDAGRNGADGGRDSVDDEGGDDDRPDKGEDKPSDESSHASGV